MTSHTGLRVVSLSTDLPAILACRSQSRFRKSRSTTNWPIIESNLLISVSLGTLPSPPRLENPEGHIFITARFQVPICLGCTPYFFDNCANVISSQIASSANLALKLGEWFFRFVSLNDLFHKLFHPNYWPKIYWPKIARLPLVEPLGPKDVPVWFGVRTVLWICPMVCH